MSPVQSAIFEGERDMGGQAMVARPASAGFAAASIATKARKIADVVAKRHTDQTDPALSPTHKK